MSNLGNSSSPTKVYVTIRGNFLNHLAGCRYGAERGLQGRADAPAACNVSPNVYQNSLCKAQHCWLVLSISSKSGTKNGTRARNIEHHCGTSHTCRCKFSKILLVANAAGPSENDISYYRSSNLPCFLLRPSSVF